MTDTGPSGGPSGGGAGVRLRAALWAGRGRGLALILPGRTEFLEKVAITAAALAARGFAVAAPDWRGQGLSDRRVLPSAKGHVGDFAEYLADLAALLAAPEVAAEGPPVLVLGHSMGGAIALLACDRGLLGPVPLVLSAPMLGIRAGPLARGVVRASIRIGRATGRLDRWPPFPLASRPYPLVARFEGNLLTADRAIWDWQAAAIRAEPRFGLGLPTLGWLDAAQGAMDRIARMEPPGGPGLVLLGGAERVVSPAAVRAGAARLGMRLASLPGARHEPLIEAAPLRAAAWAAVDGFLGAVGL